VPLRADTVSRVVYREHGGNGVFVKLNIDIDTAAGSKGYFLRRFILLLKFLIHYSYEYLQHISEVCILIIMNIREHEISAKSE
jgi:hypothetical protein